MPMDSMDTWVSTLIVGPTEIHETYIKVDWYRFRVTLRPHRNLLHTWQARSLGSDFTCVSYCATSFIRRLSEGGIAKCGHGLSIKDLTFAAE